MCVRRPMSEKRVKNECETERRRKTREKKIKKHASCRRRRIFNQRKKKWSWNYVYEVYIARSRTYDYDLTECGISPGQWICTIFIFLSCLFSFVHNLFEKWIMYRQKTQFDSKKKTEEKKKKNTKRSLRPINYEIWSWQTSFVGDDNVNEMRMAYRIVFFFISTVDVSKRTTWQWWCWWPVCREWVLRVLAAGSLVGRSMWRQLTHIAFQVINWAFGCSTMALNARRRDTAQAFEINKKSIRQLFGKYQQIGGETFIESRPVFLIGNRNQCDARFNIQQLTKNESHSRFLFCFRDEYVVFLMANTIRSNRNRTRCDVEQTSGRGQIA